MNNDLEYEDKWYIQDCLMNCVSQVIEKKNVDLSTVFCDYYSFSYRYDNCNNFGANYILTDKLPVYLLNKYTDIVNNTYCYLKFKPIRVYGNTESDKGYDVEYKDAVTLYRYITDSNEIAWKALKEAIDRGDVFICAVDIFWMPYHAYYKKKHAIHYILVMGYDDLNRTVEIRDVYSVTNSNFHGSISYDDIQSGRCSDNPYNDDMYGISGYEINNLWVDVRIPDDLEFKINKKSIISESLKRMICEERRDGIAYGLNGMKQWIRDLETYGMEKLISIANFNDKRVACISLQKSRYRFKTFLDKYGNDIGEKKMNECCALVTDASDTWKSLGTLFLRFSVKPSDNTYKRILQAIRSIYSSDVSICGLLSDIDGGI